MGFFSKKKTQALPVSRESEHQYELLTEKKQFYLLTVRMLFQFIKDFSFDLKEINAEGFKEDIDKLSLQFETEEKTEKIKRWFEASKVGILSFIHREKDYLLKKDTEFKSIIKILSSGIVTINSENEEFNKRIHEGSLKLEKITHLTDIQKIKSELEQEVAQLKRSIEKKQGQDAKHMQILSSEVEDLKVELKKTKSASMTDGLSGAYNRSAFDAHISELVSKGNTPFSLLMIDIDDFKQINDTLGHQVGDRVIMALVQKCKRFIREDDFLARYGGEEFVIILPRASLKQSLKKAQALCKDIAETQYAIDDSGEKDPLSFKVSIGVSTLQNKDTVESVIERADKALYEAKRSGKNQAVSEKYID